MATRVARMATLADLPTETICEILKYVLPEDLESFAGTCRTTASVAQPVLEVHRDLIRKHAITRNTIVECSISKLAEEVADDRIGRYVICLECIIMRVSASRADDEHTLTLLLRFLPNLRNLALEWWLGHLFQLKEEIANAPYKAEPTLTRLEAVHLRCTGLHGRRGVRIDLVQAFSALPSVRQLFVTNSNSGHGPHGPINPRDSNVIRLDLWSCYIDLIDLHRFLQGFTRLQSFGYSSPTIPSTSHKKLLDTSLIARGLLNSKSTLRKLVVVAPRQKVSTIGSLTDFRALEQLQADLELLPGLARRGNGVPSLQLPDSLETLKLQSDKNAAIKYRFLIELAISRKSSTRCQLRELMLAFSGNPRSKSQLRKTLGGCEDYELKALCKSVGMTLTFHSSEWPTGPGLDIKGGA